MGVRFRCCPLWCYARYPVHGLMVFYPVFRERHVVLPVVDQLCISVGLLVDLFVLLRHFF